MAPGIQLLHLPPPKMWLWIFVVTLYVKYNEIVASGAQNARVVLTELPKPMVWIGLLNPRVNVSGFGHISLQKSNTFVDLLNPRANVSRFGHVSL